MNTVDIGKFCYTLMIIFKKQIQKIKGVTDEGCSLKSALSGRGVLDYLMQ